MFQHARTIAVGAGIAGVIAFGVSTSAVGDSDDQRATVTSSDIVNRTIKGEDSKTGSVGSRVLADGGVGSPDLRNGGTYAPDLSTGLKDRIDRGKVTGLESDAPYPGATDLGGMTNQGDNSDAAWVGDEGATLQVSWVQCAPGKVAVSGGFQRADEGVAAIRNLQIVTSAPVQIEDGSIVYDPIPGDEAGSLVPNGWLVEGFNNGTSDLIVRPAVECARLTQ